MSARRRSSVGARWRDGGGCRKQFVAVPLGAAYGGPLRPDAGDARRLGRVAIETVYRHDAKTDGGFWRGGGA